MLPAPLAARQVTTPDRPFTASPSDVRRIASGIGLGPAQWRRALELLGVPPASTDWIRGLDRLLLALGVGGVLAGVAAFFAWNWGGMHRLTRFTVIEGAIVLGVAVAAWRGIDSAAGRGSLFAAAFFVGTLFAVYGQAYQTGADSYGLFLVWGLLIALWVVVGRQAGLWMLLLVLANLTMILYWTQVLRPSFASLIGGLLGPLTGLFGAVTDSTLAMLVFSVNAASLAVWEWLARRGIGWMSGRWFPRLVAVIALTVTVAGSLLFIFDFNSAAAWAVVSGPIFFIGFTLASLWYYQFQLRDLFMLTITALAAIIVVTAVIGRSMSSGGIEIALVLAVLVIAQTAGAAIWLRNVSRRWSHS